MAQDDAPTARSWLRDTMPAWLRIITVSGDRSLTMDQQARLLTEVNGPVQFNVKLRRFRWPWQRAVAAEALDAASVAALTLINRQYLTAMLTTEHLITRLRQATGVPREQILQEMSISIEAHIAAAEAAADGRGGDDADPGSS